MANESEKPRLPGDPTDELQLDAAEDGLEESGLTVEEEGKNDDEYRLADEVAPDGESAARTADWYYMIGQQARQGPVSLGDLQRLVAAGELDGADRVWRSGLAEWTAVKDVPELAEAPGPPPPPKPAVAVAEAPRPDPLEGLRHFDQALTEPRTLRAVGWSCAALGTFVAAISVPLAFFWRSWFTGGLLLLVASLVFLSLARIVEKLEQ